MNKNLGMGVMINMLTGNESTVKAFTEAIGKRITGLELKDDCLEFTFLDNSHLTMYDDGQSCCESRYMRTDDNLADYIGGELKGAEIRDAPSLPLDWGEHEVQFLVIETTKGNFTLSSHNEHNGYYGGFSIKVCKKD